MITVDLVAPDQCMTCHHATIRELALAQMMHGSVALCEQHAQLMLDAVSDVERARRSVPVRHKSGNTDHA